MTATIIRLGQVLMLSALLTVCGGQWLVLQSVAWAGMLVKYSREARFTQAVSRTFDGRHPCNLCKTIETAKKNREPVVVDDHGSKVSFLLPAASVIVRRQRPSWELGSVERVAEARAEEPEAPPPRTAQG